MKKSILVIALSLLAFTSCIPEDERNCGKITYKTVAKTQGGDVIYSITIKAGIRAGQSYNVGEGVFKTKNVGDEYCHTNPSPRADGSY